MASGWENGLPIAYFENNNIQFRIDNFDTILNIVGDLPVAIVSVTGPPRTGKSYIFRHLWLYLQSTWRSMTVTRKFLSQVETNLQSNEILLWPEVFIVTCKGREVAVLLMDTQGGYQDPDTNQLCQFLALSCLLSSTTLYNVQYHLTEEMLQLLHFGIGVAKLHLQPGAGHFSRLVCLVRDWSSSTEYDFGYYDDSQCPRASIRNYKNETINENGRMPEELRMVHQNIVSSFEDVACCLMPNPGKELAKFNDCAPKFMKTIEELMSRVLSSKNLTVKKINGQEVTGQRLKSLIRQWNFSNKTYVIPKVKCMAIANAEIISIAVLSKALKIYDAGMQSATTKNGLQRWKLSKLHRNMMKEAVTVFLGDPQLQIDTVKNKFLKKLKKDIGVKFASYLEINELRLEIRSLITKHAAERRRLEDEVTTKMEQYIEKRLKEIKQFEEKLFKPIKEIEQVIAHEKELMADSNADFQKGINEIFQKPIEKNDLHVCEVLILWMIGMLVLAVIYGYFFE